LVVGGRSAGDEAEEEEGERSKRRTQTDAHGTAPGEDEGRRKSSSRAGGGRQGKSPTVAAQTTRDGSHSPWQYSRQRRGNSGSNALRTRCIHCDTVFGQSTPIRSRIASTLQPSMCRSLNARIFSSRCRSRGSRSSIVSLTCRASSSRQ